MPDKYPAGDPRNVDKCPNVGGVQTSTEDCVPDPYTQPDSTMGAYNPNTAAGQAWGAAHAATGLSLDELVYRNDLARRGLGPPIPGFGPDGRPLPTGLSPLGYAAGGVVLGAVLSAFVGYGPWPGALAGGLGGYLFGRFSG